MAAARLAPGGGGVPAAVALEVIGPDTDAPSVRVRFAFGPSSAPGLRWAWLPGASADLGPGTGPAIERLAGPEPAWLVAFSRIESGGARPVAVRIRPDEGARRLDLEALVLGKATHVFGPVIVERPGGATMLWGESSGAQDRIRALAFPPPAKAKPATLAQGLLAPRFAAAARGQELVAAWLEEAPAHPEGWDLRMARFDQGATPTVGPTSPASFETPVRLLGIVATDDGVRLHMLVRKPLTWVPTTLETGHDLADAEVHASKRPRFAPATQVSAAVTDAGLVMAWSSPHANVPVAWAWSGRTRWPLGPMAGELVVALARSPHGVTAAWSGPGRLDLLDVPLGDADADSIPDIADLCPELPEPVDGLVDHDGCPDPVPISGSPLEAARVWLERPATGCALPSIARVPESLAGLAQIEDQEVVAGASHPDLGILLAGPGGLLLRLEDPGAKPVKVAPPPGVKKDVPVSVVLSEEGIFAAWRNGGAFHRKGWSSKWTRLGHVDPDDEAASGARALVRSGAGDLYLVTRPGGLYSWSPSGWMREEAGLESVWIIDAFSDQGSGRVVAVGIGGRPVLLTPHAVDRRIVVSAKHFLGSGKKVKKSVKKALGGALGPITSGTRLVRLEGHTDSKGSDKTNLAISLARAKALEKWLVAQGARPEHIEVIGFGEAFPIAGPSLEKNRRVVVVLLEP